MGISLLEMACDMELPNGGTAWHQLRYGFLPEQFTSRKCFDMVLTGFYVSSSPVDLSPELLDILKWMMHPQPQSRYSPC